MNKLLFAGAAAALALMAGAAQASTVVYSFLATYGPVATPNGVTTGAFAAPAGAATLTFTLDGYASLDGANSYEDDFTLRLNGSEIAKGTFDMGGGGGSIVFFAPTGSVITPMSFGFFAGGKTDFLVPLTLVGGVNSIDFLYSSPGPDNGCCGQGLGDEGWGVHDVVVTSLGVPEPASWALMIGGFGLAGAALRRRRAVAAAA